jgi:hypothetical protein
MTHHRHLHSCALRANTQLDVNLTGFLHLGRNVLAAELGNGWWSNDGNQPGAIQSPPMFRVNASITLASGSTSTVVTDASWTSHPGPVVYDSV